VVRAIGSAVLAVVATAWIALNAYVCLAFLIGDPYVAEGETRFVCLSLLAGLVLLAVVVWRYRLPEQRTRVLALTFAGGLTVVGVPLLLLFTSGSPQ